MSMPEFPKPNRDFTQEQALTMILSSIASEEEALSHIIKAEGDKLQYILNQANCCQDSYNIKDILAINKSITSLLEMVMQNQMILKSKMEAVLDHLPPSRCPIEPPCSPEPPCPPMTPCCIPPCRRFHEISRCLSPVYNCKCTHTCEQNNCTPHYFIKVIFLCFIGRFRPY